MYSEELYTAVRAGNAAAVKELLDTGANPNQFLPTLRVPPIYFSVSRQNLTITRLLLKAGATPTPSVFYEASYTHNWDILEMLLDYGADPNSTSPCGNYTALHRMSLYGDAHIAEKLLQRGADPNALTCCGSRPFTFACRQGSFHVAVLLLTYGAVICDVQDGFFAYVCDTLNDVERRLKQLRQLHSALNEVLIPDLQRHVVGYLTTDEESTLIKYQTTLRSVYTALR